MGKFADLHAALQSLENLDAIYREYRADADRVGTCAVRDLVARARARARQAADNPRLDKSKRREKQEIVQWCKVWLEVPDLFFDWVEMRREAPDFQEAFAHRNGFGLPEK